MVTCWTQGDQPSCRLIARRARTRRVASCCSWLDRIVYIPAGAVYVHSVLFPGNDIWDNTVPWSSDECAECARRYGRGHLVDEREKNPR